MAPADTSQPRVVSLLPSATEIAVALGLRGQLVGRSHQCDWPTDVREWPVCTSTKLEQGLRSIEIERRVQEIVRSGLSVYDVDAPLLRSLKPDVILTQSQCAVCAVTPRDLEDALAQWIGAPPQLISLAPDNMNDVWADFRSVGMATNRDGEAEAVIGQLKARLAGLTPATAQPSPRVLALEWLDPLMAAGNWIPELITAAGGQSLLAQPGQHSPWICWNAIEEADPDFIVMMPCGYTIHQTLAECAALEREPVWHRLRAVRQNRIYIADGHHFFNRPGPRLVESAAILSEILNPAATTYNEPRTAIDSRWIQYRSATVSDADVVGQF